MLLFALGALAITLALLVFLYTLHLGLRRHRWRPLAVVVMLWLIAMVAYVVVEVELRPGRSVELSGIGVLECLS